jgi:hypothetical protein
MVSIPSNPKIYHITHIDNLPSIVNSMELVSDAKRVAEDLNFSLVGMSKIKQRRLNEIEVSCHRGTTVGQYVPFYFCPRSVMLYILYKRNHPELTYKGGQQPIIHLEADFKAVINWANRNRIRWAFTDGNAGAYITNFYSDATAIYNLNWDAINSTDFGNPKIKEGKQAEFLMFDVFPWELIHKIGTINSTIEKKVKTVLANIGHQPIVAVEHSWYF